MRFRTKTVKRAGNYETTQSPRSPRRRDSPLPELLHALEFFRHDVHPARAEDNRGKTSVGVAPHIGVVRRPKADGDLLLRPSRLHPQRAWEHGLLIGYTAGEGGSSIRDRYRYHSRNRVLGGKLLGFRKTYFCGVVLATGVCTRDVTCKVR